MLSLKRKKSVSSDCSVAGCFWLVIFCFVGGGLYYLVIPVAAARFYISSGYPLYSDVQSLLLSVDWVLYWQLVIGFFFAFLVGVLLSIKFPLLARREKYNSWQNIHPLFFVLLFLIQLYCYFLIRGQLFTGYMLSNWNEQYSVKAFLSGLNITLATMLIFNHNGGRKLLLVEWIPMVVNSVVLLGLGGRMYVLCGFLALLIYFRIFNHISLRKIFLAGFSAVFLMLIVGVLRSGATVSTEKIVYIFIGEPVLNWIGGANFLVTNAIHAFEAPSRMLSSLVGFVPTIIWPGKAEYLSSIGSDFIIESPAGGTHVLISLLSNFGVVGSMLSVVVLGFFSGLLAKIGARRRVYIPFFAMHCALLSFMFFRDTSLIHQKSLLINAFLIPYSLALLSAFFPKKHHLKLDGEQC
ncbi:hypothetical protein [Zhongshania aliphaticivorans]|uniref:hypothetical protein n=1 Tax=Zhongshania aliphaticivorans TaxID=1470434 RepID=UPI0012E56AB3|nr:hypothetical protein [Zhongshania aliphaticivorans]CAA0118125.1 Uncharacterised protein [Zhongshania aliphaticivorans]